MNIHKREKLAPITLYFLVQVARASTAFNASERLQAWVRLTESQGMYKPASDQDIELFDSILDSEEQL